MKIVFITSNSLRHKYLACKLNNQEKYFGRDKYGDPVVVESTINLTGKILDVKINNFNHSTLFGDVIFNKKRKVAA